MDNATSRETLDTLPFDVRELIITHITSPNALLAMALCSRSWKELIIPEHLEYRELRVRVGRHEIWKHLNSRPDLARRIVALKLMSEHDPYPERFPTTLSRVPFNSKPDRKGQEDADTGGPMNLEMLIALLKLRSLESLNWLGTSLHGPPVLALKALAELPALKYVDLQTIGPEDQVSRPSSPIWSFRNLEYLSLVGSLWRFGTEETWRSLSTNLPHLKELALSYSSFHVPFTTSRFPSLESARLYFCETDKPALANYLTSQDIPIMDRDVTHSLILDFLAAHPGIKHLSYYPLISTSQVARSGILPNLVSIHASHSFACHVLSDESFISTRAMERIYQLMLSTRSVDLLSKLTTTLQRQSLKELRLTRVVIGNGVDLIRKTAEMFPCIETLEIDRIMFTPDADVPSVIDLLSTFPNLRVLMDSTLWAMITAFDQRAQHQAADNDEVDAASNEREDYRIALARACPKLETIKLGSGTRGDGLETEVVIIRRRIVDGGAGPESEFEFVQRVSPGQRV